MMEICRLHVPPGAEQYAAQKAWISACRVRGGWMECVSGGHAVVIGVLWMKLLDGGCIWDMLDLDEWAM